MFSQNKFILSFTGSEITIFSVAVGARAASVAKAAPAKGMVWVNTATKVFHREGDRWYGKTKAGKYMTEEDALKEGYRPVKERAAKKAAKE